MVSINSDVIDSGGGQKDRNANRTHCNTLDSGMSANSLVHHQNFIIERRECCDRAFSAMTERVKISKELKPCDSVDSRANALEFNAFYT